MLIRADARAIPLADACVDCVVTSPPYWGLRDYGTATWTGGDASCSHNARSGDLRFTHPISDKQRSNAGSAGSAGSAGPSCLSCGATRIDVQIGLEPTPEAYVAALVTVFREIRRVLKDDGTIWLNLGDSYATGGGRVGECPGGGKQGENWRLRGLMTPPNRMPINGLKPKDLVGIPWRVIFALQTDGWYLRSDIIWAKPNPMPESVMDRPTKAHEYVFLLTKSERYYYDADAIAEPTDRVTSGNLLWKLGADRGRPASHLGGSIPWDGDTRNRRSVWTIPTECYRGAHFATMPEALVEPCVLAGCPLGGLVLDPFCGTFTVGAVAARYSRRVVGLDLTYQHLARERTAQRAFMFDLVAV